MSLFSSQPRIEGGQYGYHPHYRKDYGFVADVRKYFRRVIDDFDESSHICQRTPAEVKEDEHVQMTLSKYRAFLERYKREGVGVGERKRER